MKIREELFSLQDLKYRDFHSRLMPNIDKDKIIGVRIPEIRKLVKRINAYECEKFISNLPHTYYEENNLHAFIIEKIKDFDKLIYEIDKFLPYVDNWATCDSLRPDIFRKNKEKLKVKIDSWLSSKDTYTVRFAIGMIMIHFLDEDFNKDYLETVSGIISEEYYINMMIAWFFATALAKQYESAIPFIENNKLSKWVHNKTIQKAIESYRIPEEIKEYLRKLKRGEK